MLASLATSSGDASCDDSLRTITKTSSARPSNGADTTSCSLSSYLSILHRPELPASDSELAPGVRPGAGHGIGDDDDETQRQMLQASPSMSFAATSANQHSRESSVMAGGPYYDDPRQQYCALSSMIL